MPNSAQKGPITLYAPRPVLVEAFPPKKRRFDPFPKLKILFSALLIGGLGFGFYFFADQVSGVIAQGGSAVTLDRVLDENFNLSLAGSLSGSKLVSTTTGADPLKVSSTDLVENLNSDLLDGQHGSYYLDYIPTGWTKAGTRVRLTTATDKVGIGTANPETSLHVLKSDSSGSQTSLKGSLFELYLYANDADPFNSYYAAAQGRARYYGADTGGFPEDIGHIRGLFGTAANYGTGMIYAGAGVEGQAFTAGVGNMNEAIGVSALTGISSGATGSVDRAMAFYTVGVTNSGTGTIANGYGLLVGGPDSSGGAITNYYGVYVENPACPACGTSWAFYTDSGNSYLNGDVTIGDYLRTSNDGTNAINMYDSGLSLESYFDVAIKLDNDNSDVGEAFRVLTDGGTIELLTVDENEVRTINSLTAENGLFSGLASGTVGYLSVMEDYPAAGLARLINQTTDDDPGVQVLRVGLGTATTGTSSRFVSFYAGVTDETDGTGVGTIRLNNGNVAYDTGGADYAEWVDVSEAVSQGDIISLNSSRGSKSRAGDRLIGVVSDTAGFVGNSRYEGSDEGRAVVGFLGQIRTKVTGEIRPGDQITASGLPGVGVKATKKGSIVGIALEGHSGSAVSKIRVFVNPGWYDPGTEIASTGLVKDVVLESVTADSGIFAKLVAKVTEIASAVIDNLKVKFLTVGGPAAPTGITIYDRATGEPYCVSVVGGAVTSDPGACE